MAGDRKRWRFTLRTLLVLMLWLATLLATYRFSFDSGRRLGDQEGYQAGHRDGYQKKLEETPHARAYYVGDLLARHTFDELIARVQTVDRQSWDRWGGIGSATGFNTSKTLVVLHTGHAHNQIQACLNDLRSASLNSLE
jgi:hypothetical protein